MDNIDSPSNLERVEPPTPQEAKYYQLTDRQLMIMWRFERTISDLKSKCREYQDFLLVHDKSNSPASTKLQRQLQRIGEIEQKMQEAKRNTRMIVLGKLENAVRVWEDRLNLWGPMYGKAMKQHDDPDKVRAQSVPRVPAPIPTKGSSTVATPDSLVTHGPREARTSVTKAPDRFPLRIGKLYKLDIDPKDVLYVKPATPHESQPAKRRSADKSHFLSNEPNDAHTKEECAQSVASQLNLLYPELGITTEKLLPYMVDSKQFPPASSGFHNYFADPYVLNKEQFLRDLKGKN